MRIRKSKKEDLKQIAEIFMAEFRKHPYNEKWTLRKALKKINEYFNEKLIFVLSEKEKIAGFIIGQIELWDTGNQGYIAEFVVSSDYQGKGYGKKLMNHFQDCLKKKGVEEIQLMSSLESEAFKIYEKLGFKKTRCVLMKKRI